MPAGGGCAVQEATWSSPRSSCSSTSTSSWQTFDVIVSVIAALPQRPAASGLSCMLSAPARMATPSFGGLPTRPSAFYFSGAFPCPELRLARFACQTIDSSEEVQSASSELRQ